MNVTSQVEYPEISSFLFAQLNMLSFTALFWGREREYVISSQRRVF